MPCPDDILLSTIPHVHKATSHSQLGNLAWLHHRPSPSRMYNSRTSSPSTNPSFDASIPARSKTPRSLPRHLKMMDGGMKNYQRCLRNGEPGRKFLGWKRTSWRDWLGGRCECICRCSISRVGMDNCPFSLFVSRTGTAQSPCYESSMFHLKLYVYIPCISYFCFRSLRATALSQTVSCGVGALEHGPLNPRKNVKASISEAVRCRPTWS